MKKMTHFIRHLLKKPEGKLVATVAVAIIILFGYYFYAVNTGQVKSQEVVVSNTDHVRGAQAGTVTLVEFGDFQCPACGAYEPIVRKVLADNPTILKVVFRHFPLTQIHQNAMLAAKASESASLQGKFWEMHDIIYDNQKDWSGLLNARDVFVGYAKTLKLDTKKFETDLNNPDIEAKIMAEYAEGNKLGIQGTPTFFVNGKMISNPQSPEEFDKVIKDAAK